MSVDIDWSLLGSDNASDEDDESVAGQVRRFLDQHFQQVKLPAFIRRVAVSGLELGKCAPEVEIKDVCDPLPEFYNVELDEDDGDDEGNDIDMANADANAGVKTPHGRGNGQDTGKGSTEALPLPAKLREGKRTDVAAHVPRLSVSSFDDLSNATTLFTPGLSARPTLASQLSYFQLPISRGSVSGAATPLAAVATGAATATATAAASAYHYSYARPAYSSTQTVRQTVYQSGTTSDEADESSPPISGDAAPAAAAAARGGASPGRHQRQPDASRAKEREACDVQIVARIRYSGDFAISLTADILLDYAMMPNFVGIPIKLTITGFVFDGVAVVAYLHGPEARRRAHFCFLSAEHGTALVGGLDDDDDNDDAAAGGVSDGDGSLLQNLKVESEIGEGEGGKQVLKNVGKVENFVLDQVRRVFDEELVYPSFWTFLI